MKKQLVAASIAAAVGITGLTGVGIANATTDASSTSPMSGLVDAISTKFKLNKTEVQAVFDEQHAKMEADREAQVKEDVAKLVTDGKLTQDQADKLLAKRAEIEKAREALKDSDSTKTREEMRTEMQTKRTELETWAKDNGINTEYLRYVMGHGGRGHGPGGPRD